MIEAHLRPLYQTICVDPIAKRYARYFSANFVTLLAFLTGLAIFPCLLFRHNFLAILFLLMTGYFDTLDGTVARYRNQTSDLGTVLDIMSDRFIEASVVIGLFMVNPATRAMMSLCMISSILMCVTSFLVVGIFSSNDSNKGFYYSPGLMERPEAFLLFALMIIFESYFKSLSIMFSVLVMLTAMIRILEFASQCGCFKPKESRRGIQ